jgi:Flp pilus assembly protein TadB/Mg-chelatase subunit ChlD
MRRRALGAALLGFLALVVATPQAVAQGPLLVPAGTPTFPERAFRLTVPERRALSMSQLTLTENGEKVRGLSLTSVAAANTSDFGTVLVIDASKSMHGAAIERAIEAAREVAAQRASNQQLGVVVFNRKPTVVTDLTTDQNLIDTALAVPPNLAAQTRIFDAVDTALGMLAKAKITAGSIIVLSDGADTNSLKPASAVGSRARKANVRIFTVGLRSRSFDKGELSDLAKIGRGRYFPADSVEDLGAIFRKLGAELATEYLIRYRSETNVGRKVTVAARVDDVNGLGIAHYTVPGGASFVLVDDSFWTSTVGIMATTLLCALLIAIGLALLVVRRHRRPELKERVRDFVTTLGEASTAEDVVVTSREARSATERSLEKTQWWPAFKEDVEIGRIEKDPVKIVIWTAIGTFVLAFLLVRLIGPLAGLFAVTVPLGVRGWIKLHLRRQRRLFAEQLPDILQGCASAIRAGHGLTGSLAMISDEAPEPSRLEFQRVVSDEQLGVPLDDALRVVQQRMDSRDVQQIALVAQLQRDTGGNMAEVLDRVTDSLRRKAELRRMVQSLTAQGRLSRWVVSAIPIALLAIISLVNPDYVEPLYTTPLGNAMLVVAGILIVSGSLVIKKIVDFKV